MFSDHDKTSPSIVAVTAPLVPGSLFHARGAATEKALSPICRRVRGTKKVLHIKEMDVDFTSWCGCTIKVKYSHAISAIIL